MTLMKNKIMYKILINMIRKVIIIDIINLIYNNKSKHSTHQANYPKLIQNIWQITSKIRNKINKI
jgi:hypothetical protein